MREAPIEAGCLQDAQAAGLDFPKLTTGRLGRPDRILPVPGQPAVYVELKQAKGRVKPHQRREHVRLRRLGYRVEVVRSREAFRALLAEYGRWPTNGR